MASNFLFTIQQIQSYLLMINKVLSDGWTEVINCSIKEWIGLDFLKHLELYI